jgi:hypothetical protein
MKNLRCSLFLIFILLSLAVKAQGAAESINVGYYIKFLAINNKEENAIIDLYYWYRFKLPKDTTDLKDYYNLEIVNGDIIVNDVQEERLIGDQFYVSGRLKGKFHFVSDFANYPFDKQKLYIQLEHPTLTEDMLRLVPDSTSYIKCRQPRSFWGLSKGLESDGLFASSSRFELGKRTYETDFGDPEIEEPNSVYSNLSYCIFVSRDPSPYTIKFMLPLIIILCLAYLVFYIPADALDLACGLTVTSLLAGIAFQWTISDDLPDVGYLTCVDKIFYLSYILIMLAMVQTVWTYHLEKNGNVKLSNMLEILGRWLFPIFFFGGSGMFIWAAYY